MSEYDEMRGGRGHTFIDEMRINGFKNSLRFVVCAS